MRILKKLGGGWTHLSGTLSPTPTGIVGKWWHRGETKRFKLIFGSGASSLRLFLVHVPTRHCPLARAPGGKGLEIRSRERSRAPGRVSTGVIPQRRGASFGASGPADTGPGAWSQGTAWAAAYQPRY